MRRTLGWASVFLLCTGCYGGFRTLPSGFSNTPLNLDGQKLSEKQMQSLGAFNNEVLASILAMNPDLNDPMTLQSDLALPIDQTVACLLGGSLTIEGDLNWQLSDSLSFQVTGNGQITFEKCAIRLDGDNFELNGTVQILDVNAQWSAISQLTDQPLKYTRSNGARLVGQISLKKTSFEQTCFVDLVHSGSATGSIDFTTGETNLTMSTQLTGHICNAEIDRAFFFQQ